MAIPVPQSYPQILSSMLDSFLSRFGISNVKPGSPILSIMEAAAQSDLRASQDIFSYLNSINLDQATGDAVDKIGLDEDLPRFGQTSGAGVVAISDTSFTKKITKIYVGLPAPIIGTIGANFYVADATGWPTTGSIYIGRGTANYEGPIAYTALTSVPPYWRLNLTTATQKFHNLQEPVILAQGGNRTISAGTIVQSAQGNANEAVQFSTLYSVVVPDGETSIDSVAVVASKPGTIGNITAGAIVSFATPPFVGAAVTNLLPVSNAKGVEDETDYKERIRNARQSRAKGTPLAITSGVLGILAPDENKTVLSASVVTRQGFPATLYIDDGTGYEETSEGVAIEGIVGSAFGGEKYFEVNNRPVAKAFVQATITEPYTLEAGSKLAVKVNGITFSHTFSEDEFRNIANASAYEVVSSINSDPACPYNARLADNGNSFAIISDEDTQENLEVTTVEEDELDANQFLGLTPGIVDTMLLYKNDRLLSKDGRIATLTSASQATWGGTLASPATVTIAVDNTPATTYSITSQDFIDQRTGYTSLASTNSLDSWVTVFNARLPGVTAIKSGSTIIFVSNIGKDIRSRLSIVGGSLVSDGVLLVGDSVGISNDFTLDRNTGQLRLEDVLAVGDVLAAGTVNTRAFVESTSIPTTNFTADAESWWVVDGAATLVGSGVGAGTAITLADYATSGGSAWGDRVRVSAAGNMFTEVRMNNWVIFNDSNFNAANRGAYRVAYVDPAGVYFEIERKAGVFVAEVVALAVGGITFVNTLADVQRIVIDGTPSTYYTASSLADSFNTQLRGATAYVSRTTKLRVRTNTFGVGGDIALVAFDTESIKLKMAIGDFVPNLTAHLASVEAEHLETGTPEFITKNVTTINSTTSIALASSVGGDSGHLAVWSKPFQDVDNTTNLNFFGQTGAFTVGQVVTGAVSGATGTISVIVDNGSTGTLTLTGVAGEFLANERITDPLGGDAFASDDTNALKDRWSNFAQHAPINGLTTALPYDTQTANFTVGQVVTGATSKATAVISADADGGAAGTLTLYNIDGVFPDNELITDQLGGSALVNGTAFATTMLVRDAIERTVGERVYAASPFAIGPTDDLTVLIDDDQQTRRYSMPMYRKGTPGNSTYGATNDIKDNDNANLSLAVGFGLSFDWLDYAVWMHARVKTHSEAGDTTKTVLYRYYRFGEEGNQAYVKYDYPLAASSAILVNTDNLTDGQTRIGISVPTGAARTGVVVRNSTRIGTITAAGPGVLKTVTYIIGFSIATALIERRLRVSGNFAVGNFIIGDALVGGTAGTGTVTAVNYSATNGRGYVTLGAGVAFAPGETITGGGGRTGAAEGSEYNLATATLDIATPGATDHGFNSHIVAVVASAAYVVGDVVRGDTSNAVAIIREKSGNNLIVSELAGTFAVGESLTGATGGASVVASVTNPTNVLYMTSTSGAFSSGLKNIVGRTIIPGVFDTIQYVESSAAVGATPTPGDVSWDIGQATTTGSTAVNGDLVNVSLLSSLPNTNGEVRRTLRTTTLAAQYWKAPADAMTTNNTVTIWGTLNNSTYLSFFPVSTGSATAAMYATAVNAITNSPVTALAIGLAGVTTGVISQASWDEFNTISDKHYPLTDGINWIKTQINPGNPTIDYNFTFKDPVSASLAGSNSGWASEDIRLVPTTTKNVVDWLNAQAVSGLSSVAETARSVSGDKPQISSLLPGKVGSVQVQGGSSNSLSAAVVGSGVSIGSQWLFATTKASEVAGLHGGQWVAVQNFIPMPKVVFGATTSIASISAAGLVTLNAPTNAWNYANTAAAAINGFVWQVEKQGAYVAYTWNTIGATPDLAGIKEGDWVVVSGNAVGANINSRNQGTFRIVRVDDVEKCFWIENPNELDERKKANLLFIAYDSVLPGDIFLINTTALGTDNQGSWTVASIDTTDRKKFTLDISTKTPTLFTGPLVLGTIAPLLQIIEGSPTRLIKRVRTISPNANTTYADIKFETSAGYRQVGSAAGSIIQSLDKLSFPTGLIQGVDGYRYSTGLIQEVNKVAYGDPGDSASYPGIVAAGAQVNIEGPLVKRVACSLALRLKSGVGENDIKVRVRSAVASVINNTNVGASISISDLIDAAGSVAGVVAVTWLAPQYGAGNDLISVQPFEKPLVLDLVKDIVVSLVSE